MDVSSATQGSFTVVRVTGEVDLYTSPRMRDAVLAAAGHASAKVVVDLSGVSYMDSSGIASLVEGLKVTKSRQGRLVLAGLSPRVREVFELARLQEYFEMAPDVASVVGKPAAGGA